MKRLFFALSLLIFPPLAMADGRAFDAVIGNDTRHYPPDPQVNFSTSRSMSR